MQKKLAFAFGLVTLAFFVLIGRLIFIIATKGDSYQKKVLNQQNYTSTVLPFRRGTITDRNQTVLAASEQVYNLILDPSVILQGDDASAVAENVDATVAAVAEAFSCTEEEIRDVLQEKPKSAYVRFRKLVPEEQKSAFETLQSEHNGDKNAKGNIRGVWFEPEYRRVYPYDSLACTVLGFSGTDSSKGSWGVEQYYNDYLTGTNGRQFGYLTSDGAVERISKWPEDGNTVVTTLDYTVQRVVENAIAEFCEDVEVDNVGVLVMDPSNAEILAMATNSVYDLNHPTDLSSLYAEDELSIMSQQEKTNALYSMWRNFCISDAFEPGSTTKAFTEAAALEENLADGDTLFVCDRGEQVVDRYIHCAHLHGNISLAEALGYSCNDVMMQLGKIMGKTVFCKYQAQFGLGRLTGIDLPGEASGILYSEDRMGAVDLATNTFGQNFTATMIQVAAAYVSILNGGSYYQPHIVKEILNSDGDVVKSFGNTVVRETISSSTAEVLRKGLALGIMDPEGTGQLAKVPGYDVGGKTGTAEKYPRGKNMYLHSFIGCVPADNPELLIYVVVDNPQKSQNKPKIYKIAKKKYTVSETAVPLEQKIMASLVEYLNITPNGEEVLTPEPETDEAGNEVLETDAEGNPVETEADTLIEPTDADDSWEDEIPEGGFLENDSGPPKKSSRAAAEESEEAEPEPEVDIEDIEEEQNP